MSYSIHIERLDDTGRRSPIDVVEWSEAVAAVDGVRLTSGDIIATNPHTGEALRIATSGADAEVYCPARDTWLPTFLWSARGRASFAAATDFDAPGSVQRAIASELARKLGAALVGDEGERYD